MERILTVEEIEYEAHRRVEIFKRRLELIEAYHNNLITGGELEDALLLLSLRAPPSPPPISGEGKGGMMAAFDPWGVTKMSPTT